jgi:hypothetical protein
MNTKSLIHYNFRSLEKLPNVHPQLVKLWNITHVPLIDRTRSLEFPFEYEILSPIPIHNHNFDKTFEQICLERAKQIWHESIAQERPIHVYWSGGIDSTCALISILRTAHQDYLDQITVHMNVHSQQEYPSFFETYIKDKLRFRLTGVSAGTFDTNAINVTGELGDQLFGSMWMINYLGQFDRLFDTNMAQHLSPLTGTHENQELLEYLSLLLDAAPFEIRCVYDLVWWLNFSCKWQDVQLRFIKDMPHMTKETFVDSVFHFFDTADFQLWSMKESNHRSLKTGFKWRSYKKEAKQFIYEFTLDANYRDFKRKIGSLRLGAGYPYKARLNDFTVVKKGDPL